MPDQDQFNHIRSGKGFIAALDQSGGSTPKALAAYGVTPDAYGTDAQMYDLIHAMRSRIAQAPCFKGDKILGAILFENTLGRQIGGKPSAQYLWQERGIVPFLKVDKGLEAEQNHVQLMKAIPDLEALLERAQKAGVFGTKMRSVIGAASEDGIAAIVRQQFDIAKHILSFDLIPIVEPEISISTANKQAAEDILLTQLTQALDALAPDQTVMLKLTLPEQANHYQSLSQHPRVLSVVALSGGYSREKANGRLAQNTGMIASFSRALSEGLSAQQSDADFNTMLAQTVESIYRASISG